MGKHNLPWVVYNASDEGDTYVGSDHGDIIICEKATEEHAHFIVKAANYHYELVKALKELVDICEDDDNYPLHKVEKARDILDRVGEVGDEQILF